MESLNFSAKKVLVRVDFNVPLNAEFQITDDTRIRAALPTIQFILAHGGAVILMSHLGRPLKKLKADGTIDKEKFTLFHLVDHLSEQLGLQVQFSPDLIGAEVEKKVDGLKAGEVLLLENTRFHSGETSGDPSLAKALASYGDLYINDAFGSAHRAHVSTTTVATFFKPEDKAFGLLMQREIENASRVLQTPEKPLTAIVGGAKVSDKILLLDKLLHLADHIIIGGAMAYTFVKSQGGMVGNSLVEEDKLETAQDILQKAAQKGVSIHLPVDSLIADSFSETAAKKVVESGAIPTDWMGLDVGPAACVAFRSVILESKTILWNGPMGVFEMPSFAKGTFDIASAVAAATDQGAFSLVGGGDSVSAVNKSGLSDRISFVSTGGGAMLEFLEGKTLPGVAAIQG